MPSVVLLYKKYFTDGRFVLSVIFSILLFAVALTVHFFAVVSASERASNPVTDIVLNNIRVFDVHIAFIYGPLIMWLFFTYLILRRPNQIPFALNTITLFVLIRSIFINLTHIGPFPTELQINPESFITYFSSGGDLFFSGHTGLPFLLALIFWDSKLLRYAFTACAVFFGMIVLMGHLHYSIDVFSAFFITFSIYRLAEIFFKKDKKWFDEWLAA